jgi:hypothetical protein
VAWVGLSALTVLALLGLLLAVDGSRWTELTVGDSVRLVSGSRFVENCLTHGVWTSCGEYYGHGRLGAVASFPLAQYLIAVPLVSLGFTTNSILTVLAVTSGLAVLGMLALVAFPVRRLLGTEWAVVLAVAIVTGPFVLYSLLPFGEALAAFLAFAFTVAACCRRPVWIFALALLAGVTKETAAPFLLVLGLVCARTAADRFFPPARVLVPLVGGLVAAVSINLLFNVFRFGTTSNVFYNGPYTRVPGVVRRFKIAIADWFAPNVGVLWFWFLAGLIVAGLVVTTFVLVVRHPRDVRIWLPPLAVVGSIAAFTAGIATWWSSFGWIAWGPRLTIPFVPAFLLAGIWAARDPMTEGLRWIIRRPLALGAVTVVVVVLALPQVGVVWNPAAIRLPLVADSTCPDQPAFAPDTLDYIYRCELHQAWRLDPLSLGEAAGDGPATQQLGELLIAVVVIASAVWLYRRARDPVELIVRSNASLVTAAP